VTEPITYFRGEHEFLSNFHPSPMVVQDQQLGEVVVATVEHGFQADKTELADERLRIITASSPGLAKRRGRSAQLRADWEAVKLNRMRYWLRQKFAHPALRARLIATGDAELVEGNWWGDRFWGVCDDQGQNWLGRLLMELRDELRK
jgi:ribA/ribD-fused uncharacterized protein